MRKYLILVVVLLAAVPLVAQRANFRDAIRFGQMNEQGVWSVGVRMEPVVALLHPLSDALGGGKMTSAGVMGMAVEGGYFIVDNVRLSASLGFIGDTWSKMFSANPYEGYTTLSQLKFRIGAHWHLARWDVGGGVSLGNTTMNYVTAISESGGEGVEPRFGDTDLRDSHTTLGLFYEAGYMVSPFLKVGAFWEPSLAFGGGYSQAAGLRLTIYLPFVNAVVCK